MIVTCENCLRRYSVAEEMVRRKAIKFRCKGCQRVISLPAATGAGQSSPSPSSPKKAIEAEKKTAATWDGLSAVAMPAQEGTQWFAIIKGKQSGPFQSKDFEGRFKAGEIGRRSYVWREGMTDWKRAEDVPELSEIMERANAPLAMGDAADHRRETFPEKVAVQERPLPALKLSPELLAAPPEAGRENQDGPRKPSGGQSAPLEPHEETRFFIAEAGLHRRNPPWKIAAFAVSVVALPAAVLYLLATFKVGPLVVTRVDAAGHEFTESVFSSEGSGLRELLSGRKKSVKPVASRAASKPAPLPKPSDAPSPLQLPAHPSPDLRALYADGSHVDVGPTLRKQQEKLPGTAGALAPSDVAKVVAQSQSAFQFCIEQEMKKNPSFRGGKIFISAVVGSSGTVKQAAISRPDIDASSLGECLKAKARRMIFAAFSGDDTEVQIPLILTTSL